MLPLLYNFIYQSSRIAQTIVSRHYCGCEGVFCTHMIPLVDIKRFIADCFISLGATDSNAEIVADGLVNTDYMGEVKYGVSQLENYIKSVDDHTCNPKAQPQIEEEHTSVAVVNGNNGFGHVTAKFCMDVAMEKALTTGIGMVAAKVELKLKKQIFRFH
ncbi:hypothetical protein NQ315_005023 [Exocentrus adspersus]|uniref:Uncharacterized protein n=1 Tax=Exocentrus adspersus TaxID=1586481 RepID=A0AAV8VQ33_9CUCU|nr:hypothetical protein NQ315_005023 [Exocentrus adspersus]